MTFSMAMAAPASVTVIEAMEGRISVGAATVMAADMEEAMAMATVVDMATVSDMGAAGASDPLRHGGFSVLSSRLGTPEPLGRRPPAKCGWAHSS